MLRYKIRVFVAVLCSLVSGGLYADGIGIDKVYDPYVQLLEKELEYRTFYHRDASLPTDGSVRHILGYGQALSDRFFAEVYVVAEDAPGEGLNIDAYELELKWQLSEQGEFSNDWGLLFELEEKQDVDIWEAASTLLIVREWSRWVATGNFSIMAEWGRDIRNEMETAAAGQLRYRRSAHLEPAIEVYKSQGTSGIGPVLTGLWRLGEGAKLMWEFGVIAGLTEETPDVSWKLNIEYEFR